MLWPLWSYLHSVSKLITLLAFQDRLEQSWAYSHLRLPGKVQATHPGCRGTRIPVKDIEANDHQHLNLALLPPELERITAVH